ncbi:hypothetical protein BRD18_05815 [Halobacteriales archaeon SW_7_71_33]|nr:MAG: hypothetical protein BRD18_05815 [Halobacteriales archaeon SW_7_71_33]
MRRSESRLFRLHAVLGSLLVGLLAVFFALAPVAAMLLLDRLYGRPGDGETATVTTPKGQRRRDGT